MGFGSSNFDENFMYRGSEKGEWGRQDRMCLIFIASKYAYQITQ